MSLCVIAEVRRFDAQSACRCELHQWSVFNCLGRSAHVGAINMKCISEMLDLTARTAAAAAAAADTFARESIQVWIGSGADGLLVALSTHGDFV